jgi:phospholipid/cholesterol/gamma-HCH transport system substrate-binding protein
MNKEFLAGVFVLIGLGSVGFVYVSVFVGQVVTEQKVYHLDANDVTGIAIGSPVMMRGYNVGRVTNISVEMEPRLRFEVELGLLPDIPIPKNSEVLLGSRLAGGGELLAEGEHLILTPVTSIQDLLGTAEGILKDIAVMTKRGREFIEDPNQGLELRLQEVDKILTDMSIVLEESSLLLKELGEGLDENQESLSRTIKNIEVLSEDSIETLDSMDGSLKIFDKEISNVGEIFGGYDLEENQDMNGIIRSLDESSKSLERLMKSMEESPFRTLRKGVED